MSSAGFLCNLNHLVEAPVNEPDQQTKCMNIFSFQNGTVSQMLIHLIQGQGIKRSKIILTMFPLKNCEIR